MSLFTYVPQGRPSGRSVRKYGLNLILAHQYIEQRDEKIRAAILGNVGTIISFRVGAKDAKYLAREFHPVFDGTDLINLPDYHIYLKLMINGRTSQAFSAATLHPPEVKTSHKTKVIEASRIKFARTKAEVEREILAKRAVEEKPRHLQRRIF